MSGEGPEGEGTEGKGTEGEGTEVWYWSREGEEEEVGWGNQTVFPGIGWSWNGDEFVLLGLRLVEMEPRGWDWAEDGLGTGGVQVVARY